MKKFDFTGSSLPVGCASQINAQLIIRNNGHKPCHYKTAL